MKNKIIHKMIPAKIYNIIICNADLIYYHQTNKLNIMFRYSEITK